LAAWAVDGDFSVGGVTIVLEEIAVFIGDCVNVVEVVFVMFKGLHSLIVVRRGLHSLTVVRRGLHSLTVVRSELVFAAVHGSGNVNLDDHC